MACDSFIREWKDKVKPYFGEKSGMGYHAGSSMPCIPDPEIPSLNVSSGTVGEEFLISKTHSFIQQLETCCIIHCKGAFFQISLAF